MLIIRPIEDERGNAGSRRMGEKHEKHSVADNYWAHRCSLTNATGRTWAPRSLRNILQPIANNLNKEKVDSATFTKKRPAPLNGQFVS